jgi:hypothetical protein
VHLVNQDYSGYGGGNAGDRVREYPEIADWAGDTRVVFGAFGMGLWTVPATGGIPSPLITGGLTEQTSDWFEGLAVNPSGTEIVGHMESGSGTVTGGIATLPVSGGTPKLILADPKEVGFPANEYLFPSWSSDGSRLVLVHDFSQGVTRLATMSAGGGTPDEIVPTDSTVAFPVLPLLWRLRGAFRELSPTQLAKPWRGRR